MNPSFHAISPLPNLIASPKFERLLQLGPLFPICLIGVPDDHQTFNYLQFDP